MKVTQTGSVLDQANQGGRVFHFSGHTFRLWSNTRERYFSTPEVTDYWSDLYPQIAPGSCTNEPGPSEVNDR